MSAWTIEVRFQCDHAPNDEHKPACIGSVRIVTSSSLELEISRSEAAWLLERLCGVLLPPKAAKP